MESVIERARLRYTGLDRGRPSDKVYVIELIKVDDKGYIVTCWNGAAAATNLTKQPKIKTPVGYSVAKAKFDVVLSDKTSPYYRTPYEVREHWTAPAGGAAPSSAKASTSAKAGGPKPSPAEPKPPQADDQAQAPKQPPPYANDPLGRLDALEL